jgi:hypothetical protein
MIIKGREFTAGSLSAYTEIKLGDIVSIEERNHFSEKL